MVASLTVPVIHIGYTIGMDAINALYQKVSTLQNTLCSTVYTVYTACTLHMCIYVCGIYSKCKVSRKTVP